jgi:hypothetical protein
VDGQEKTIHAINMKHTPLVRTVSQANIDAARRIDFNRIRGRRAGGAEDRIQQPLLINEEQKRRRIISEMEIVGAQSEEQKRDNRNLQISNRKRKQRKRRLILRPSYHHQLQKPPVYQLQPHTLMEPTY